MGRFPDFIILETGMSINVRSGYKRNVLGYMIKDFFETETWAREIVQQGKAFALQIHSIPEPSPTP